jgi:hypothetical protein
MKNATTFASPRQARIRNQHWLRSADAFANMGLRQQEFRAVSSNGHQVFVHEEDLVNPPRVPVGIRPDIVEFLDS